MKGFPDACCGNEFAVLPVAAKVNGKTWNYLVDSPQGSLFTHPPSPLAPRVSNPWSYLIYVEPKSPLVTALLETIQVEWFVRLNKACC